MFPNAAKGRHNNKQQVEIPCENAKFPNREKNAMRESQTGKFKRPLNIDTTSNQNKEVEEGEVGNLECADDG